MHVFQRRGRCCRCGRRGRCAADATGASDDTDGWRRNKQRRSTATRQVKYDERGPHKATIGDGKRNNGTDNDNEHDRDNDRDSDSGGNGSGRGRSRGRGRGSGSTDTQ